MATEAQNINYLPPMYSEGRRHLERTALVFQNFLRISREHETDPRRGISWLLPSGVLEGLPLCPLYIEVSVLRGVEDSWR